MSWKQKTVIRILMLIARMYAEDDDLKKQLETLACHLSTEFKY